MHVDIKVTDRNGVTTKEYNILFEHIATDSHPDQASLTLDDISFAKLTDIVRTDVNDIDHNRCRSGALREDVVSLRMIDGDKSLKITLREQFEQGFRCFRLRLFATEDDRNSVVQIFDAQFPAAADITLGVDDQDNGGIDNQGEIVRLGIEEGATSSDHDTDNEDGHVSMANLDLDNAFWDNDVMAEDAPTIIPPKEDTSDSDEIAEKLLARCGDLPQVSQMTPEAVDEYCRMFHLDPAKWNPQQSATLPGIRILEA